MIYQPAVRTGEPPVEPEVCKATKALQSKGTGQRRTRAGTDIGTAKGYLMLVSGGMAVAWPRLYWVRGG